MGMGVSQIHDCISPLASPIASRPQGLGVAASDAQPKCLTTHNRSDFIYRCHDVALLAEAKLSNTMMLKHLVDQHLLPPSAPTRTLSFLNTSQDPSISCR